MTKIELLWFKCPRCGKSFLSYVEGKHIWCDDHQEGICFNDEDLGEIHDNHYLNTIPNKRECPKCRKHIDLMSFGLHT